MPGIQADFRAGRRTLRPDHFFFRQPRPPDFIEVSLALKRKCHVIDIEIIYVDDLAFRRIENPSVGIDKAIGVDIAG